MQRIPSEWRRFCLAPSKLPRDTGRTHGSSPSSALAFELSDPSVPPTLPLSSSTTPTACPCAIHHVQVRRVVKHRHHLHVRWKFPFVSNPLCSCCLFFPFQIQLTSLSSIKGRTNSINPSPCILDSAVIELHFIRTAYRGMTDTASLQRGQLKYVRGNWASVKMSPRRIFRSSS